jgi:hypothetical protein
VLVSTAPGADYFVSVEGVDDAARDGKTQDTSWASLAYACDRVPTGEHTIHVLPGEYVATRTAYPRDGVAIVGRGSTGEDVSRIVASEDWKLPELEDHAGHQGMDEYLIAASAKRRDGRWLPVNNLTIANLELCSLPEHRITGAVYCRDGTNVKLQHLNVHDFRWNGLRVEFSKDVEIHHCRIRDASTQKVGSKEGGLIRTRWLKDSRIHHNRIIARRTCGYGYKGGGHEAVRFDHNFVDTTYFAIESPFENELGFEIDHNRLTRCISIPKWYQEDPAKKGYDYSVRVHHNVLTDSYTIEGPRGYAEIDHNYIRVERTGGRIYSHHGAKSRGPIRIHHNVIENVDMALVWMNEGLVENLEVFHNTIFCADAGRGSGRLLDAWAGDRLNNWQFKNNIVVAAWSQPRQVHPMERGVPDKIEATHNMFVNFRNVPVGNIIDQLPQLKRNGAKPAPFYLPANARSNVIDRGTDVGMPFHGKAPDLGAFEFGQKPWTLEGIPE